jgi:hypothetical protein
MSDRVMGFAILCFAAFQRVCYAVGLPGWPCLLRQGFGCPCPGCGLTRAIIALLRADFKAALTLHAFAPVVLGALVFVVVGSLLPAPQRQPLVRRIERLERRTGITAVGISALFLYWLARLALFYDAYAVLMKY